MWKSGAITNGAGYSYDREQVATQTCFNTEVVGYTDSKGEL